MNLETLVLMLTMLARVEMPALDDGSERHVRYLAGLREMASHYLEVGKAGAIVSPEIDPLLLAAIGYGESRHQPKVRDGDCNTMIGGKTICAVVGPMQVSRGTMLTLGQTDTAWSKVTLAELRRPRTSVEAAYRLLAYHRSRCKGGVSHWLGAWSAGRCFDAPIAMGSQRCALAAAMARHAGVEPPQCAGTVRSKAYQHLVAALSAPARGTPPKASDGR